MYFVFKALNELKTKYDVFNTNDYSITQNGKTKSIHLNSNEMNVVILGNFDVIYQEIDPSFQSSGNWYEFYTGDTLEVSNTSELITLAPGEYRLYTDVKLDLPNIPASINTVNDLNSLNVHVYPNPSSNTFYFEIDDSELFSGELLVYNIQGQLVFNKKINSENIIEFDASGIENGLYMYKIISGNKFLSGKLLKN